MKTTHKHRSTRNQQGSNESIIYSEALMPITTLQRRASRVLKLPGLLENTHVLRSFACCQRREQPSLAIRVKHSRFCHSVTTGVPRMAGLGVSAADHRHVGDQRGQFVFVFGLSPQCARRHRQLPHRPLSLPRRSVPYASQNDSAHKGFENRKPCVLDLSCVVRKKQQGSERRSDARKGERPSR